MSRGGGVAFDAVRQSLSSELSNEASVCAACNALRNLAADPKRFPEELEPAIPLIFFQMKRHADNVAVQKCSVMALASLGEKKGLRQQIAHSGGLSQLLAAWSRHEADESLVKDMLVTFRTVTALEENRVVSSRSGGVEATLGALARFPNRSSIQGQCFSLLTNLAFESVDAKVLICKRGGVQAVVGALHRFQALDDAKLQAKGCALLRNIAAECPTGEAAVVAEGGIDRLTFATVKYRSDQDVLEQALSALINLARSPSNHFQPDKVHAPVLREMQDLLSRSRARPDKYGRVHELVITLFGTMAKGNPAVQAEIGECGGLRAVVEVVHSHLDKDRPAIGSTSYSVVRRGAVVLRCLAFVPQNREKLVQLDRGVEVLVKSVSTLRMEAMQVEQALIALGNTLFDSPDGKASLARCNGVCTLLSVMTEHPHVSGVQEACCLALRAVCDGSSANSEEAVKLGGVLACLHVLRAFAQNAVLQEQGLAAVIVLMQNCPTAVGKYSGPADEAATQAVDSFPYSVVLRAQRDLLAELNRGGAATKVGHRRKSRRLLRSPSAKAAR
jgi:hypothetical protein